MATLNLSFTVPDAQASQIQDDLCTAWGYTGAGGETKTAFVKRKVAEFMKNAVINQRVKVAADAAASSTAVSTDSAVTFT